MQRKNLLYVGIFAVAMAYLEAAVVVYLRRVYGINDLILSVPPFDMHIGAIELGRELATLVMLLMVGMAAGKKLQSRLGFVIFAFGLWDIFYYVWLRIFIGWPRSALDPDLLFLIPLPWWGPVLSPVLIAILMTLGGALAVIAEERAHTIHLRAPDCVMLVLGILIMLYTFMADALATLPADVRTLSLLRPTSFNWPVFLTGYLLVVASLWRLMSPIIRNVEK